MARGLKVWEDRSAGKKGKRVRGRKKSLRHAYTHTLALILAVRMILPMDAKICENDDAAF